jgi:hypothetical protein
MATVKNVIGEHDVVALRDPVARWPAGTVGAVVSDYGDDKLIEITDDKGVALDYIQVSAARLDLRQ